jgi:hypothetical protein
MLDKFKSTLGWYECKVGYQPAMEVEWEDGVDEEDNFKGRRDMKRKRQPGGRREMKRKRHCLSDSVS